MKKLKKFRSPIATLLTVVFATPLIYSCSANDADMTDGEAIYAELEAKYAANAKKMADSLTKMDWTSFSAKNISSGDLNITQELVDEYAAGAGYAAGEIQLSEVEQIFDKHSDLINNGLDQTLEDLNLSSFTKLSIKEILDGEAWIADLQQSPNYAALSMDEKEILTYMNTMAKESVNMSVDTQAKFWNGFTSFSVGVIVGGLLFASPLGLVVGGFIGMYIHILAKP